MNDDRTSTEAELQEANDAFHETYDASRKEQQHDVPVFVVLEDELVVFRRGRRRSLHVTPPAFHLLKAAAHVPIALFAASHRGDEASVDRVRAHAAKALLELEHDETTELEVRRAIGDVLALASRWSGATSEALAKAARAPLARLTELATGLQLRALHATVEGVLVDFDDEERASLQVVVTGNHQARVRSLGMQYFRKRLEGSANADARLTYGEGIEDADAALELVATRRLDAVIAEAFFDDPTRLQRDVLGDAVRDVLEVTSLAPIDRSSPPPHR